MTIAVAYNTAHDDNHPREEEEDKQPAHPECTAVSYIDNIAQVNFCVKPAIRQSRQWVVLGQA